MVGHFGYAHLAIAAFAGLIIGAGLMALIPITTSYDQCMLTLMSGQPQGSHYHASTICLNRHPTG
jgi:hypothetical protein